MSTQQEVADHLDISDGMVRKLIKNAIFPRAKGKQGLKLDTCRLAYINYLRSSSKGITESEQDLKAGDLEQAILKEDLIGKRLKNGEKAGQLVNFLAVITSFSNVFVSCRARLRTIKAKAKVRIPKLTSKDLAILDNLITEVCNEISNDKFEIVSGELGDISEFESLGD